MHDGKYQTEIIFAPLHSSVDFVFNQETSSNAIVKCLLKLSFENFLLTIIIWVFFDTLSM